MSFKIPRNDNKYYWTKHAIRKMVFYGLTPDRVKRILRHPIRIEYGVAENTVAVMTLGPSKKKPTEIWTMYSLSSKASTLSQSKGKSFGKHFDRKLSVERLRTIDSRVNRKIIISAWRYPGVSPIGKRISIPQDILEELKNEGVL